MIATIKLCSHTDVDAIPRQRMDSYVASRNWVFQMTHSYGFAVIVTTKYLPKEKSVFLLILRNEKRTQD